MINIYPTGGYDGPIHMSEEASNAATAVPLAIVMSLGVALFLGFGNYYILQSVYLALIPTNQV